MLIATIMTTTARINSALFVPERVLQTGCAGQNSRCQLLQFLVQMESRAMSCDRLRRLLGAVAALAALAALSGCMAYPGGYGGPGYGYGSGYYGGFGGGWGGGYGWRHGDDDD